VGQCQPTSRAGRGRLPQRDGIAEAGRGPRLERRVANSVPAVNSWHRPRWQDEGEDPDYRYSLANERTFLAWIRTSLSLIAAAVAVIQLVPAFRISGGRWMLGIVLAATGFAAAILGYVRWASTEKAMRLRRPIRYGSGLLFVSTAIAVVGLAVLLLALAGPR
jgi:putative membrane protein